MIDEILLQNNNLKLTKTMVSYLKVLEGIIPAESRENFYKNLHSLKILYNKDLSGHGKKALGLYSAKDNTITLESKEIITSLRKRNFSDRDVLNCLEQILLHEFVHMSASSYDKEKDIGSTGFEKTGSITNEGLDEGMTEFISLSIATPKYQALSDYVLETHIACQLFYIVGKEDMLKAYFSGAQTKLLEEKLDELQKRSNLSNNLSYELLRQIEAIHILKDSNVKTDSLYTVQNMLLDFLGAKLNLLNSMNKQEDINTLLDDYSKVLLTPENIKYIDKDGDKYVALDSNKKRFDKLMNYYYKDNDFYKSKH